ncbi:hypothetical protein [uncultured Dokdonia sp.]|uniref:hypothetical protein n=1 Tax=uncultured Dokdonia sp. TaxID=575653 RepID=UPI002602591B|nr:hypothetical protein [uncultured Dokdonia sp.]
MKNLLSVILVLILIMSCSKDEINEDTTPTSYDDLIVTSSVSQIGLDDAKVVLSTNIITPLGSTRTFFYKEFGTQSFLESTNGILTNLVSGKKYEAKARVTINGTDYDSQTLFFTTKGYLSDSEVYGEVDEFNKKFTITFVDGGQNVSEFVQPLVAYAKVGQDSVQVENISYVDNIISFEINADTQQFFENDTQYISNKEFTLGFFSGDYYQNLITPQSSINYDGEITNRWNFFNKKPRLDSYMNIENSDCLEPDNRKEVLDIQGKFWGLFTGPSLNTGTGTPNIPDNLTIRLTNINNPDIEKLYFINDLESIYEVYTQCDLEAFGMAHEIVDGAFTGFHSDNFLRLRFNKNFIITGNYNLTFAVEKENVTYTSDEFMVVID